MIIYKSPSEIARCEVRRIPAATIERLVADVSPGIATARPRRVAEAHIDEQGAIPSFKGYTREGFPASICASINQEVVHGIPAERRVEEGDILSLDFGAIWEGFHADSALTMFVGDPRRSEAEKLVRVTEESLEAGISQIRPASVCPTRRTPCSRSWGRRLRRRPRVRGARDGRACTRTRRSRTTAQPGRGPVIKPGLVVAVEPMVNTAAGRRGCSPTTGPW